MIELPTERPTPTPEAQIRHIETISKHPDKNERIAWSRKNKKLIELVDELAPFEERIFQIILEKQPLMDQIAELRAEMVKVCVHPKDQLIHQMTHVHCKFCNRNISLPNIAESDE